MGHSRAGKAANRERILGAAAAQIRAEGLDSVSVAGLMGSVGLTHGGFYGHFGSRDELLVAALTRALHDAAATAADASDFEALVRSYLSRKHRNAPDTGCAIAALAGEVGREDETLCAPMAAHIERFVERVARLRGDRDDAALVVSALVGALALSRVLGQGSRSDAFLHAVRRALMRPTPGAPGRTDPERRGESA